MYREQEDPGEMYMYVEAKEIEHNRGSPDWRDAKKALESLVGRREREERMNESAAHRVAQKDGLGKLPVNW